MNTRLTYLLFLMFASTIFFVSCNTPSIDDDGEITPTEREEYETAQLLRPAWYYDAPITDESKFTVTHEAQNLSFFSANTSGCKEIYMTFPDSTTQYNRAILTYTMGGWNEGPAEWDMTTQILIFDNATEEYYEIARAITPYGGSFDASWSKSYYLDVTEYLPMLVGDSVEFRVYYGGWDATALRKHTVQMTYDFYSVEDTTDRRPIYYTKIYDSNVNTFRMRGWVYGSDSIPIEGVDYLGLREFTVPEEVNSLLMKVAITGHGMEQGTFPDRTGYSTKNCAEFDYNIYDVILNGESKGLGMIYYENSNTYSQAGTYYYDRANWGPGLPINTQWWYIANFPEQEGDRSMTIDFDLENYISPSNSGDAYYIIQVDIFGFAD